MEFRSLSSNPGGPGPDEYNVEMTVAGLKMAVFDDDDGSHIFIATGNDEGMGWRAAVLSDPAVAAEVIEHLVTLRRLAWPVAVSAEGGTDV